VLFSERQERLAAQIVLGDGFLRGLGQAAACRQPRRKLRAFQPVEVLALQVVKRSGPAVALRG
jgi:hypothetical protein